MNASLSLNQAQQQQDTNQTHNCTNVQANQAPACPLGKQAPGKKAYTWDFQRWKIIALVVSASKKKNDPPHFPI